jgi:exosome complex RNA-binding protein Rrp4
MYSKLSELIQPENAHLRKKTNTTEVLHQIAENIHKRSLVIIFSDMIDNQKTDELFSALQHLRYNKHEVILFHVTDHKLEREFEFSNRPHKFVDMENGQVVKFNPWEIRKNYVSTVQSYFEDLKVKCGQYQIDLAEADINKDFNQVLFSYLVKRKKLF